MKPDLSVEIAGIKMQNPVMNGAGTFELDIGRELIDISKLGAFVQKSITFNPREGNPQPRILEVAAGVINSIGLQNVGVKEFVRTKLPLLYEIAEPINLPLIISIAGESVDDYLNTALILESESRGRIAALEVNISCPNVKDGLIFGSNPSLTKDLVGTLKLKIRLPLIVKLTPNVDNIGLIAKTAVTAGADALSLINTIKAKAYIDRGPHARQWIEGGLSGPAIKPVALKKVDEVVKAVDTPVIGMGGICELEDALDFLRIGATAIAVGTATFRDPSAMVKIIDGLEQYLRENGYASIAELKKKEGKMAR